MFIFWLICCFSSSSCGIPASDDDEATLSTSLLSEIDDIDDDVFETDNIDQEHYDAGCLTQVRCNNYFQELPLDPRVSILQYLHKCDIHSLMRTSKNNRDSCKQYVRNLLSIKFDYLLTHNESEITLKHLLNIPFVSSIAMNASSMPFYFAKKRNDSTKSSKYIGIDSKTNNGFISFWLKRIKISDPQCNIITIVFNATNIHCIYWSDTSDISSLHDPIYIYSLERTQSSNSKDINGINAIMLNGKIRDVWDDGVMWCLNDQWKSSMFWPKIKDKMGCPYILVLILLGVIAVLMLILAFLSSYRH